MGDFLAWRAADMTAPREGIAQTARLFLGDPYYWGGRSAFKVDCSGLVGLTFQAHDITIPRDAHEQWMKARPISREQLAPGDLVFLSDAKDSQKITHVMLYVGNGRIIEGPGTGEKVREINLDQRLRAAQGRRVAFGSYLE